MFVFFTSTIPLDLFWRAGGRGQGIKPHLGSLSASSRSYAAAGVGQRDGLQGNSERVAAVHLLSASLSPYFGKLLHINVLSRVIFFRVIFFFFFFLLERFCFSFWNGGNSLEACMGILTSVVCENIFLSWNKT